MAGKPTYSRRRPEQSALHQVVRDNLRTLYAATEQGFATPLPAFVKDELEGYVNCGVLSRGFAVLACPECSERIVVGFSCKGLGFCASCLGAARDHGTAPALSYRQVRRGTCSGQQVASSCRSTPEAAD